MEQENLLSFSLCIVPFLVPALLGFRLLAQDSDDDLARMAGLLTLKPLLTTPIWIVIGGIFGDPYRYRSSFLIFVPTLVAILPGASLTLVAAMVFRSMLSGPRAGGARLLLVLDCVRWFNSLLVGLASSGVELFESLCLVTGPVGLAMPTVFAVVAHLVVTQDAESRQRLRRLVPGTLDRKVTPSPAEAEEPATQLRPPVGRDFWLRWVLASTVGWAVEGFIPSGVGVGVMQWLVLRHLVYRAGWWVLASVAGRVVGLAARLAANSWGLFTAEFGIMIWMAFDLVGAVTVGVIQWFVLRRQVYRAGWWIAASIVGRVAGWAAQWAVMSVAEASIEAHVLGAFLSVVAPIVGAVAGAVNGAITGISLVWLLRHPIPQVPGQEASTRLASSG